MQAAPHSWGKGTLYRTPLPGRGVFASTCTFQIRESYLWATWFSRLQGPSSLVEEAGSCFCCFLKNKKTGLQNGRQKSISHPHACPSPSILYNPQTHLDLPPTMSGQRTGRQGRTGLPTSKDPGGARRARQSLSCHPDSNTRLLRVQRHGWEWQGRLYKPEMRLFMETGAGCLSARREPSRTSSLLFH